MSGRIGHLVFGVNPAHLPFYRDLLGHLGWQTLYDSSGGEGEQPFLGLACPGDPSTSLWFGAYIKDAANDYDGPGMNHLALSVESIAEVDAATAWLRERGIAPLFDTPRHRPDFAQDQNSTYYQVMFETPDRILLEIVYTGPFSG
jgi:catechol 2,3-dioxygenase-like lactoylglutathione lyase family enzyme